MKYIVRPEHSLSFVEMRWRLIEENDFGGQKDISWHYRSESNAVKAARRLAGDRGIVEIETKIHIYPDC